MWSMLCLCGFRVFSLSSPVGTVFGPSAANSSSYGSQMERPDLVTLLLTYQKSKGACATCHLAPVANNLYRELTCCHASPAVSVKICFNACMGLGSEWVGHIL